MRLLMSFTNPRSIKCLGAARVFLAAHAQAPLRAARAALLAAGLASREVRPLWAMRVPLLAARRATRESGVEAPAASLAARLGYPGAGREAPARARLARLWGAARTWSARLGGPAPFLRLAAIHLRLAADLIQKSELLSSISLL